MKFAQPLEGEKRNKKKKSKEMSEYLNRTYLVKAFNYYDNGIEFLCVKDRLHLKDHFTKVVELKGYKTCLFNLNL